MVKECVVSKNIILKKATIVAFFNIINAIQYGDIGDNISGMWNAGPALGTLICII